VRKITLIPLGTAVVILVAGAVFGWHRWTKWRQAPIVRAAVPPIPELAAWPREYASRVRAATAAANRLEQPVAALSELAHFYHANDYCRESQQAELGLQALEPKNAQWTYLLADTCEKLSDREGQRAFLEETLRLAPYYPPTRLKLAELLLKQGRPDEARVQYEWRLMLVPNDPYGRFGLARIALQRGDRAGARKALEAIVRDHPDYPAAHNLLSEVYATTGDAARADEQRSLSGATGEWRGADDPWLAKVYSWSFDPYRLENSGDTGLRARRLESSLPFYEEAVRLAPGDGLAWDALGCLYLQLNRPDSAVKTLEAGLSRAPANGALYATLGQALRRQGQVSRAIEVLQRGISAFPNLAVLRCDLGATMAENGRRAEAVAVLREAVRLQPDLHEAHWELGLCLLRLGQASDAGASLGRALDLRPRSADALVALAQKALDAGQLDQAGCCIHVLAEHCPGIPAQQLAERALAVARLAGDAKSVADFELLQTRTRK